VNARKIVLDGSHDPAPTARGEAELGETMRLSGTAEARHLKFRVGLHIEGCGPNQKSAMVGHAGSGGPLLNFGTPCRPISETAGV